VYGEWPQMQDGTRGDEINPWGIALFRTIDAADPRSATEQAAYSKWLDQTSDRELARTTRLHAADGIIPTPLWVVLFLIAGVIFVFMLFFADSGEIVLVQATLIASVVLVVGATLIVILVLNTPFRPGPGSISPVAMTRTLRILEEARDVTGRTSPLPCTAMGVPTA
jgi:hypothetical protein